MLLLYFYYSLLGTAAIVDVWNKHSENFSLFGVECVVENVVEPESVYKGNILCHVNSNLFPKQESYKLIIANEQVSFPVIHFNNIIWNFIYMDIHYFIFLSKNKGKNFLITIIFH